MQLGMTKKQTQILTVLAILAALAYSSWPLGYLLNPVVGSHGLASELEAVNQPYNWLFVAGDVLSSILIAAVAIVIWRRKPRGSNPTFLYMAAIVSFALLTVADTLLPLHCNPSLTTCPNFTHDPLLFLHGIFSILASNGLFISVLIVWWHKRSSPIMNGIMVGYLLFGIVSLINILKPGHGTWSQHFYLTLCSVWIALIPYGARQLNNRRGQR
jgi:hypothetical protein